MNSSYIKIKRFWCTMFWAFLVFCQFLVKLFNFHAAFLGQQGQMLVGGNETNVIPLSVKPEVIQVKGQYATR